MGSRSTPSEARTFDRMARIYEGLTSFWSNGRVRMSKASQLEEISPGDRVLYVGVGTGEDAIEAVEAGASVTCLDLSAEMIDLVRRRMAVAGVSAELIHGDLFIHAGSYDVVCANFLLDCFPPAQMLTALDHLVGLVRPGGKFLVADVTTPQGSIAARVFTTVHHGIAFGVTWLQRLTPRYPVYDYPPLFAAAGLEVVGRRFFRLWRRGPVVYQAITAVRPHRHPV